MPCRCTGYAGITYAFYKNEEHVKRNNGDKTGDTLYRAPRKRRGTTTETSSKINETKQAKPATGEILWACRACGVDSLQRSNPTGFEAKLLHTVVGR